MKNSFFIACIAISLMMCSCAHKSGPKGHSGLSRHDQVSSMDKDIKRSERKVRGHAKVHMTKEGGVYFVPITVYG